MNANSIYDELFQARQNIRQQLRETNAWDMTVCTDEALLLMSQLLPKTMAEMREIPGVSALFLSNYAPSFLSIIRNSYTKQVILETPMDVQSELKTNQKKLYSISVSNPLIFTDSLSPRNAVDMAHTLNDKEFSALLFGHEENSKLCFCDCSTTDSLLRNKQIGLYRQIISLNRAIDKYNRGKGSNTLYVGYPIAVGVVGDGIKIKAPLAFFPVNIVITDTAVYMRADSVRKPLLNASIIAATGEECSNYSLDPHTKSSVALANSIKNYFNKHGINLISDNNHDSIPFQSLPPVEENSQNTLKIFKAAVCGRFNVYDAAIQSDLYKIRDGGGITPLLSLLLEAEAEIDLVLDEKEDAGIRPNVLATDRAQRRAVSYAGKNDIILAGAPDTGIIQTVASAVQQMIAERPTARIAVIAETTGHIEQLCCRLGDVGNYMVKMTDPADPLLLSKEVVRLCGNPPFNTGLIPKSSISDVIKINKDIETGIRGEYFALCHGAYPSDLYRQAIEWGANEPEQMALNPQILACLDKGFTRMSFKKLLLMSDKFTSPALLAAAKRAWKIEHQFPALRYTQRTLCDEAVLELAQKIALAKTKSQRYKRQGTVIKKFHSDPSTPILSDIALRFFEQEYNHRQELWSLLINTSDSAVEQALQLYRTYRTAMERVGRMSRFEWDYYCGLEEIVSKGICSDIATANVRARNALLNEFIHDHERQSASSGFCGSFLENKYSKLCDMEITQSNFLSARIGETLNTCTSSMRSYCAANALDDILKPALENIRLWGFTIESLSETIPLQAGLFDLVIFIGAEDMCIERTIPALFRAKTVLIAGDPRLCRSGINSVDSNLMDIASRILPTIWLDSYYGGCHSDIIQYASSRFYGDSINIIDDARASIGSAITLVKVSDVVSNDYLNESEACVVADLVVEKLKSTTTSSIAVLSFSVRQREYIEWKLHQLASHDSELYSLLHTNFDRLTISDVNGPLFEASDIVYVTTAITPAMLQSVGPEAQWINAFSDRAIIAACTRARKELIVVTSVATSDINTACGSADLLSGLWGLLNFAEQTQTHSKRTAEIRAVEIIRNELEKICINYGCTCEYNVGNSECCIDIAICKDNKYLLGIVLDHYRYIDAEEAAATYLDKHRYLIARGWQLYDLSLRSWFVDTDKVIKEITSFLEWKTII